MVLSQAGLRPERDCAGEAQSTAVNYRPILSSERVLQDNKAATV
jgi:hypothetical protein